MKNLSKVLLFLALLLPRIGSSATRCEEVFSTVENRRSSAEQAIGKKPVMSPRNEDRLINRQLRANSVTESPLTVPEIELPPRRFQELPAWWERPIKNREGYAQQGGSRAFDYVNQSLSGNQGVEVVQVSNERFKDAPGWGQLDQWLNERVEIAAAPEYRDRSEYWITRRIANRGQPIQDSNVETTYGITWGEYSREDIEGKSESEIYGNTKFRLPEEKTLRSPVKRYFDSRGKGVAIEFRAVSKAPGSTPDWLRDEGLNQMIIGILKVVKQYPELYDKPIVTCYGDKNHRQLYEHWLNMNVQEETTPLDQPAFIHDKEGKPDRRVPWWYLEVSPRDLELVLINRTRGTRTVRNLNLPHPFTLPDGQKAYAVPKTAISFDSNEDVTQATFLNPIEIQKGIIVSKGSTAFWVDRHLVRVTGIEEPYSFQLLDTLVQVPPGATLEWNHPFLIEWLFQDHQQLGQFIYQPEFDGRYDKFIITDAMALRVQAGLATGPGSGTETSREDSFDGRLLRVRGALINPTLARVVSANGQPILLPELGLQASEVSSTGNSLKARLLSNFTTADGLEAAAGSDLVLTLQGRKWDWERIALAKDCYLNGILFEKGSLIVRTETGIRVFTAWKQFKDYAFFPK